MADHTDEQGAGGAALRPCPFCGAPGVYTWPPKDKAYPHFVDCSDLATHAEGCIGRVPIEIWQRKRPEDALRAQLRERDEMLREVFGEDGLLRQAADAMDSGCATARTRWGLKAGFAYQRYRAMEGR